MKAASIGLALLGLVAGLIAAVYWLRSTKVEVKTTQPGAREWSKAALGMAAGAKIAYDNASRLNAVAARWTAASVILNALSAVIGTMS